MLKKAERQRDGETERERESARHIRRATEVVHALRSQMVGARLCSRGHSGGTSDRYSCVLWRCGSDRDDCNEPPSSRGPAPRVKNQRVGKCKVLTGRKRGSLWLACGSADIRLGLSWDACYHLVAFCSQGPCGWWQDRLFLTFLSTKVRQKQP